MATLRAVVDRSSVLLFGLALTGALVLLAGFFVAPLVVSAGAWALLALLGVTWASIRWPETAIGTSFLFVPLAATKFRMRDAMLATSGSVDAQIVYELGMYALLAAFHALLYYFTVTMLTPFILLIAPFNSRKRCLHDFIAGTVVINAESRAETLR